MKFIILLFLLLTYTLLIFSEESNCNEGTCTNPDIVEEKKVKISKAANPKGAPPAASLSVCEDRYPECQVFKEQNSCEDNPGWMIVNCPISCNACELRNPRVRCSREFLNITDSLSYQPGEFEEMFKQIPTKFGDRYKIDVLSTDPYIVYFHDILTEEEADAFINLDNVWERSTDTGFKNELGEAGRVLSKSRTSSNAWCRSDCENNEHVRRVTKKIEEILQVPFENSENYQILQYENGQYYRVHHDMSPNQNDMPSGPRILTFFLYLSDVEEGGETDFPILNISVKPKKGAAVLWPSVMLDDLTKQDPRTVHQAKPVIKGTKYAANSWYHLYNTRKSNLWGCTGSFDYL